MGVRIEIQEPGKSARIFTVTDLVTSIGRSSRNSLVINDEKVSSRHAVLKVYSDGATIEDAGSLNGTLIAGRKITQPVVVENGTSIALGAGGPVLKILSGSKPASATSVESQNPKATNTKAAPMLLYAGIASLCVAIFVCGLGGLGGVILWAANDGKVIRNVKDQTKIKSALGKIIVGLEFKRDGATYQLPLSVGTGFIVTEDGYVITNKHVIEDAAGMDAAQRAAYATILNAQSVTPKVWIALGDSPEPAEIVHVSQTYDFGLLKIPRTDAIYFRLASVAEVPRLADVFALGFPGISTAPVSDEEALEAQIRNSAVHTQIREYFKDNDFEYDSTSGTVSRVRKEQLGRLWIQHNAAINGGNSGGPLCLQNGLVIGINTLGMKDSQGVFFALALSQLDEEIRKNRVQATWGKP